MKALWEEIRRQMGVCPSFFRLASPDPVIARGFFDLAKFAYLDNPLPSLFKETLFVYLSRFCSVRYCVTRHAAFLLGRGHIAGDPTCSPLTPHEVLALLNEPFPDREQLPGILATLEEMAGPLTFWPDYDSLMGRSLRIACTMIFLEREDWVKWGAVLRRLLGPKQFVQLMLFLAFVRIAHFWTQVHMTPDESIPMASARTAIEAGSEEGSIPQLVFEEDIEALLHEHQALVDLLLHDDQSAMRFQLGGQLQAELQELHTTRRLAQALQESEARYRDLYDHAPDMFVSVDAENGHVLECNRTLLEKTGFSRNEVIGRPVFELYAQTSREQARQCFQQFLAHGAIYAQEMQLRTREGTTIDVSLNATAVRDISGRITSSRSILRDITQQKFAENQRRLIFEASPNGILVVNDQGTILMINSRIENWFGYRREELIGKSIECLIPERYREQHAADLHEFMLVPQVRLMGKGRELYGLCQNGREIPLEIGLNPMGLENQGTILVTMTNITERLRDKEALQLSTLALQEQLDLNKTITDNTASSLLLLDTSGRVTFANPSTETVTGFTPEELIGRVLHEMLHHTHPDGTPFPITDCPINTNFPLHGIIQGYEDMFIHKAGHFYPVRCNARAIFKQGVWWGTILEIQDITDLHRAEEQRRHFTLELGRQVNERTEELIKSQTRLRELATELNLTEQRERQRIATELHDYLSQLLVVSRLKLGQTRQVLGPESPCLALVKETEDVLDQALTYTRTLVAELSPPVLFEFGLRAALEWLVKQMAHHGLKVEMEGRDIEDLVLPEDQAILLFQSVRELFLNVLKHAGTDQATLILQRQENLFWIIVQDQGKGFHPEEGTNQSNDHAVKFGLFSIRERMVAMGGSFEIQSSPGNGSTASLLVPLQLGLEEPLTRVKTDEPQRMAQPKVKEPQPASDNLPTTRMPQTIRILLVDDHVMVREGLRKMLEGHADLELVGEAGNGEEAIELAERLNPSLVIMDVNMPKLNGIEATFRIKAHHPEIVVIGLSVNTGGETQKAMLQAGAVALLPKEAAVAELYHMIKTSSASKTH